MNASARLIAFYLPQFHPIPENDEWWGKGLTEWTNAAKAKPFFPGHYQPHVPTDLGFYDLRVPETRESQAELAAAAGVEAFCYYHYWFSGKRLLEQPFTEVLQSGKPDFPFCLCWANATWTGIWHGSPDRVLIEQMYPGDDDYKAHFESLIEAFGDNRYVTVDGKPIFLVYRPRDLPDSIRFTDLWRELAVKAGLPGLYLVGVSHSDNWIPEKNGFDAAVNQRLPQLTGKVSWRYPKLRLTSQLLRKRLPTIYSYKEVSMNFVKMRNIGSRDYPCVVPNWDNTPRSGVNGMVLHESNPELFRSQLRTAIHQVRANEPSQRLVFIKAWNEWAEGNYVEPDIKYGTEYLDVIRDEVLAKTQTVDQSTTIFSDTTVEVDS